MAAAERRCGQSSSGIGCGCSRPRAGNSYRRLEVLTVILCTEDERVSSLSETEEASEEESEEESKSEEELESEEESESEVDAGCTSVQVPLSKMIDFSVFPFGLFLIAIARMRCTVTGRTVHFPAHLT